MTPNQELVSIIMMGLGVVLWPLGGFRWKGFRRILLPIFIGICLLFYPLSWWRCLLTCFILFIAAILPYGDRTPWLIPNKHGSKFTTALILALPSFVIGLTWWQFITPIIFLTTFLLSNFHETEKDFRWKICEGLTGLTIICTIIAALQRPWGG